MAPGEAAPNFQEIKYSDIEFRSVVNSGTFGVVKEAIWSGKRVAVKTMESEEEKKAFRNELKQLSRIHHTNIVMLFGAVNDGSKTCLVMEFADGGSLYDVLHNESHQIRYTTAHALSWMLQCARGVEYLHGIKLVHRDLKSPNLLLVHPGTVLKICDFGTACEARTHMTNCTGSAAWMAPEVFEDTLYSEKCDVYSFGIILWEVLSGQKPFDDIKKGAFAIMWAVHTGNRPKLIYSIPKILLTMITRCWDQDPTVRPSFSALSKQLEYLIKYFDGQEQISLDDDSQQEARAGPLDSEGALTQIHSSGSDAHSTVSSAAGELDQLTANAERMQMTDSSQTSTVSNESKEHLAGAAVAPRYLSTEGRASTYSSSGSSSASRGGRGSIFNSLRRAGASPFASNDGCSNAVQHPDLDVQLQPLPPTPESQTSVDIYEEHMGLANSYMDLRRQFRVAQEESRELDLYLLQDKRDAEQGQMRLRRFKELLEQKEQLLEEQEEWKKQLRQYES
ncbi:mitogen-activated protein kinase kinase kinase 7-like isoform X2 [Sycon ciliatum]|uniref:mitogen-activated protein kinase kinase kinase 7-like isoform X2 n=1 Tax=Sycon ciliatum TaxID=27933 RepID=UPI0031F68401